MNVLRMLKSQWLTLSSYGYGHSQSFFNFLFVLCYMLQIIKCMSVVEQKQTNKKFETHGHLPPLLPAPAPPCLGSGSSVRTLSRLPPPLPEIHVPSSRTVRSLPEGAHGRGGGGLHLARCFSMLRHLHRSDWCCGLPLLEPLLLPRSQTEITILCLKEARGSFLAHKCGPSPSSPALQFPTFVRSTGVSLAPELE